MTALAAGHETTATSLAWAVKRCGHARNVPALLDAIRALGPNLSLQPRLPYLARPSMLMRLGR